MKKEIIYKALFAFSILLAFGFVISLGIDYYNYNSMTTSAPFSVNVLVRLVEFLPLSIISFVAALIFKKKFKK